MASKTKDTATIKDWGEHPEVKKARSVGTVAAMEAAIDVAKKDKDFKPKERSVPISELKEAYEASRAQEAARLAKFEAALNRKPSRAVGGDAAPPMPDPKPPFPVPEIPNFPSKMMFGRNDFYNAIRQPYTFAEKYEIPVLRGETRGIMGLAFNDPNYDIPYAFNERVQNFVKDWKRSSWKDAPSFYGFGNYYKLPFYLAGNREFSPYKY